MALVSANREHNSVNIHLGLERLDASNAATVKSEILSNTTITNMDVLIIDLGTVTFMDSSGLGALVSVRKNIPDGCEMKLCNTNDFVAKILKLTRMDRVFTF